MQGSFHVRSIAGFALRVRGGRPYVAGGWYVADARVSGPVSATLSCVPPAHAGFGAIAQLGERWLCKPEVTGSIPVGSGGWVIYAGRQGSGSRGFVVEALLRLPCRSAMDPSTWRLLLLNCRAGYLSCPKTPPAIAGFAIACTRRAAVRGGRPRYGTVLMAESRTASELPVKWEPVGFSPAVASTTRKEGQIGSHRWFARRLYRFILAVAYAGMPVSRADILRGGGHCIDTPADPNVGCWSDQWRSAA